MSGAGTAASAGSRSGRGYGGGSYTHSDDGIVYGDGLASGVGIDVFDPDDGIGAPGFGEGTGSGTGTGIGYGAGMRFGYGCASGLDDYAGAALPAYAAEVRR